MHDCQVGGAIFSGVFLCLVCFCAYKFLMMQKKHTRQRLAMQAKLKAEVAYREKVWKKADQVMRA